MVSTKSEPTTEELERFVIRCMTAMHEFGFKYLKVEADVMRVELSFDTSSASDDTDEEIENVDDLPSGKNEPASNN